MTYILLRIFKSINWIYNGNDLWKNGFSYNFAFKHNSNRIIGYNGAV